MLFNSFSFLLLFLPAALLGFQLCGRFGTLAPRLWLVVVSIAFYTMWFPPFTPVLLVSIATNYVGGTVIARLRGSRLQGAAVMGFVSANLAGLFYYKYAFAVASALFDWGVTPSLALHPVLLPLGISFFTFTQIGYLLDCRGGPVRGGGMLNYVLFVAFFPHLLAGPILQHRRIIPQFADPATYRLRSESLAFGFTLLAIGLFKKVWLADGIAQYVSPGFADAAGLTLLPAWGAAVGYSLQLYFDFSGYSDMAIGLARLFNIEFPFNFDSPYKSRSVIDYWQRWHITLTRFLTAYVYNPISMSIGRRRVRRGMPMTRQALATLPAFASTVALPLSVTMILAGVWHGAGFQFIIFGLLHAVYLSTNHAWRVFAKPRVLALAPPSWVFAVGSVAALLLTYCAVIVAEVFFRSISVGQALAVLGGMAGLHGVNLNLPVAYYVPGLLGPAYDWLAAHGLMHALSDWDRGGDAIHNIIWIAALLAVVWFTPNSQRIASLCSAVPAEVSGAAAWHDRLSLHSVPARGIAIGLVAVVALLGIGAESEFIYFAF